MNIEDERVLVPGYLRDRAFLFLLPAVLANFNREFGGGKLGGRGLFPIVCGGIIVICMKGLSG